jgi:hypothetical protein
MKTIILLLTLGLCSCELLMEQICPKPTPDPKPTIELLRSPLLPGKALRVEHLANQSMYMLYDSISSRHYERVQGIDSMIVDSFINEPVLFGNMAVYYDRQNATVFEIGDGRVLSRYIIKGVGYTTTADQCVTDFMREVRDKAITHDELAIYAAHCFWLNPDYNL